MVDNDLEGVLGALGSGVAIVDCARRVRVTNRELQRLLGAAAEETALAVDEPCARIGELLGFSREAMGSLDDAIALVLGGEREHLRFEIEVTDREPLRAYLLEGARLPRAGAPELLLELRDVSQEWAQRRSLEHELHILQALIDAIPSPLFYKDNEGIYLGCNRAFDDFIGLPRERVVGATINEILPKEVADSYHATDLEVMRTRRGEVTEVELRYADGTLHDVLLNKAPVMLESGELVGLVGVMLDVTQLKQIEAELRRSEEDLKQQNRRLSTPILELGFDIVAVPLIGAVDADRAALIMEQLLAAVSRGKYRVVILDVTGVDEIDAETSAHFTRVLRALSLLGASCLLSGISPSVAQAMVALGVDLRSVRTLRNMKQALAAARAGVRPQ